VGPETIRHFIGGKYAYSSLRKSYGVTDPATGKEYAQVEVGLGADVNQAVLAAGTALESGPWPATRAPERAGALLAMADAIDARAGDIAAAEAQGPGLPVTASGEQAARASAAFRAAARLIAGEAGLIAGEAGLRLSRPAGVAGLVTSWRTPFLAQARAVAPALAAGATVVLRPDERAPRPAALLAEIAIAAGLPGGVLNIVHGSLHRKAPGAQSRDELVAHPAVARLSFAGEAAAWQQVATAATARGKPLSAEVAGNCPVVIFADADLDQAIDAVLFGAFAAGGQRRTATSTVLVHQPVYERVVSRLAERAGRIRAGDPADPATQVGPLPHADQLGQLTSFIRLSIREGALLAAGGRRPAGLPEGNYLAPTVLAGVTPDMPGFAGPAGGPVLRVTPFGSEAEAVALANATAHPATAYLWTADQARARRLAIAFAAASTWVNSCNQADLVHPTAARPVAAGGAGAIGFYAESRTVLIAADDAPVPRLGACMF
jgi:5-carboxymethyl-2-hydroxymuconic-semialdehyde dehydrogenase